MIVQGFTVRVRRDDAVASGWIAAGLMLAIAAVTIAIATRFTALL